MRPPLREWTAGRDFESEGLPADDLDFLRGLGGPALITLAGSDPSRTRVVTTLLHGNEPSGVRAILRYLRSQATPATNVLLFIGSVGTALADPALRHRALPGETDANRVWLAPWDTPQGEVARDVLEKIRAAQPEYLVDLHNNTGHNPAYGVAFGIGAAELALVSIFADRVVHTPIELRTVVEATHDDFPSVTIECGRAGDPVADDVAWRGLCRFLELPEIDVEKPDRAVRMLGAPVRVCVNPGFQLSFADRVDSCADLTISKDIDRHNFERLRAGASIGWLDRGGAWPLHAEASAGEECSRALFEVDQGVLRTRRDFIPIMMTTDREIAESDCLFYAVQTLNPPEKTHTGQFFEMTEPGRIGLVPGESPWWR